MPPSDFTPTACASRSTQDYVSEEQIMQMPQVHWFRY